MPFWLRTAWKALWGFLEGFLAEYGRRQRDADAGAAAQRQADDEADQAKVEEAGRTADATGALTDDDLRERARNRWLRPD